MVDFYGPGELEERILAEVPEILDTLRAQACERGIPNELPAFRRTLRELALRLQDMKIPRVVPPDEIWRPIAALALQTEQQGHEHASFGAEEFSLDEFLERRRGIESTWSAKDLLPNLVLDILAKLAGKKSR